MYLTNNNSNKKTSYAKYKVGKMGFLHRARCTELSAQTKHKHQMVRALEILVDIIYLWQQLCFIYAMWDSQEGNAEITNSVFFLLNFEMRTGAGSVLTRSQILLLIFVQ